MEPEQTAFDSDSKIRGKNTALHTIYNNPPYLLYINIDFLCLVSWRIQTASGQRHHQNRNSGTFNFKTTEALKLGKLMTVTKPNCHSVFSAINFKKWGSFVESFVDDLVK